MESTLTSKARRRAQRKQQRERRRRAIRAWQAAVFRWAYHTAEETLHTMQSGPSVILRGESEPVFGEPEFLRELLEGGNTHGSFYSNDLATRLRLAARRSKYLRESVFGSFLREHINLFLGIRSHKRFPKHPNHRERQIRFVALRIAAKISGCSISSGSRLLKEKGESCTDCGRPARLDLRICLHLNARVGVNGKCPDCGACTHPFSEPEDRHCERCGAEFLPLMSVAPGVIIARPWCTKCTRPQSNSGERVCTNCGAEFETFPVRAHSRRECRNSSWPCTTHSRVRPEYRRGAVLRDEIVPRASCAVVCPSKT